MLLPPDFPHAACKGLPPVWWDADSDVAAHRRAAEVCGTCPHRGDCLRYGRDNGEVGVWGGVMLLPQPAYAFTTR